MHCHCFVWLSIFKIHLNSAHIICNLVIKFKTQLLMLNIIFFKVFESFLIFFNFFIFDRKANILGRMLPKFDNSESIFLTCGPNKNVSNTHSIQAKCYSHLHLKCTKTSLNARAKQDVHLHR